MTREFDPDALRHLSWYANEAQLKTFAAAGKGGKTIVKIELEVLDPSALGSIMTDLQRASMPLKPKAPKRQTKPARPAPRLALPAPPLQLMDGRRP